MEDSEEITEPKPKKEKTESPALTEKVPHDDLLRDRGNIACNFATDTKVTHYNPRAKVQSMSQKRKFMMS